MAASRNSGSASLQQETARPLTDGAGGSLIEIEGREHDDARRMLVAEQLGGRLEPVHHGHPDVHQHHVRTDRPQHGHRFAAVGCLGDNFQIGLGVDQHPDARAEKRLVVDEGHPDNGGGCGILRHASPRSGSTADTTNSPPLSPAVSCPPASCARSRIPMMP
jgi:hypothetical protein